MNVTVSNDELFLLIVGLERLRDDQAREAKRYRELADSWATPSLAREEAARYDRESQAAEDLRWRLKQTPGYDVSEVTT